MAEKMEEKTEGKTEGKTDYTCKSNEDEKLNEGEKSIEKSEETKEKSEEDEKSEEKTERSRMKMKSPKRKTKRRRRKDLYDEIEDGILFSFRKWTETNDFCSVSFYFWGLYNSVCLLFRHSIKP